MGDIGVHAARVYSPGGGGIPAPICPCGMVGGIPGNGALGGTPTETVNITLTLLHFSFFQVIRPFSYIHMQCMLHVRLRLTQRMDSMATSDSVYTSLIPKRRLSASEQWTCIEPISETLHKTSMLTLSVMASSDRA